MNEEVEEIVKRIVKEGGMDEEEVLEKIDAKEEEYSGLISKEGAAHIVAKEAGVDLIDKKEESLDIDNIVSGMNNVNVTGKVVRIFEPREFETDDGKGKVANIILADETGRVRTSFWNDQVEELIEEERIEEGQVIEIVNSYVKEDNRGQAELRLGNSGQVKKSDEEIDVEVVSGSQGESRGRSKIEGLSPGERAEIRGTLVKIFANKPFYRTCPECGNRVDEKCEEHGEFQINMAISGVLDDGTDSIRTVFFRDQAEELIGVDANEAWEMTDEGKSMEEFVEKCEDELGKEIVVGGRIKMNDFFGRPEFLVNSLESTDVKEEAKEILSSI